MAAAAEALEISFSCPYFKKVCDFISTAYYFESVYSVCLCVIGITYLYLKTLTKALELSVVVLRRKSSYNISVISARCWCDPMAMEMEHKHS
jgi:hypothetical protein